MACDPPSKGPGETPSQAGTIQRDANAAPEESPRRERAGIDLGQSATPPKTEVPTSDARTAQPTRIPAAEFINTTPASKAPKVDGGARGSDVQSALAWVNGPWKEAITGDDAEAYTRLLHADFKGHAFGEEGPVDRASWIKTRRPRLGLTVTHGLTYVTANPNNTSRVSVQMKERYDQDGACVITTRTLSLEPKVGDAKTEWFITSEEALKPSPCPETSVREAISAHQSLGIAWQAKDLSAAKKAIYGGFQVLDGGVASAQYNHAMLSAGAGQWVLDAVAKLKAESTNTRLVGDTAIISGSDGMKLAYRIAGGVWRLSALWRPTAPQP